MIPRRKFWTTADVRTLRSLARKKKAKTIANRLRRSEGATRQKAHSLGISLELRAA